MSTYHPFLAPLKLLKLIVELSQALVHRLLLLLAWFLHQTHQLNVRKQGSVLGVAQGLQRMSLLVIEHRRNGANRAQLLLPSTIRRPDSKSTREPSKQGNNTNQTRSEYSSDAVRYDEDVGDIGVRGKSVTRRRSVDMGETVADGVKKTSRVKAQLKDFIDQEPVYKTILHAMPEFKAKMMTAHPFPSTEILQSEARNSFLDACADRGLNLLCEDRIIEVVSWSFYFSNLKLSIHSLLTIDRANSHKSEK